MRRLRTSDDDGAVLVEFAIIAPLFFLLIFGIVEFGWAFLQNLDVRHGAREGARLAAVSYEDPGTGDPQIDEIVAETCARMDKAANANVSISVPAGQPGTPRSTGQKAVISVESRLDTLTGFLDFAIPDGTMLSSTVEIRLEQPATWADVANRACP